MRHYPPTQLSATSIATLATTQGEINDLARPARRAHALDCWKNRTRNQAFDEVRAQLRRMAGDLERCFYCEDSCGDEIEHLWPKTIFPERAFVWENYCLACGTCNGPKNNSFDLFEPSSQARIHAEQWPAHSEWPPDWGAALLLDPRTEDPTRFLWLDLSNTFCIEPTRNLDRLDSLRAQYTIYLLRLNRDFLTKARRAASKRFMRLLRDFVARAQLPCDRPALSARFEAECREELHYSVWLEMKRQHVRLGGELAQLFALAPEALGW